ncbi:MAG: proline dehydrogenase [Candidatus Nitrosocaldaceae archaeon]|nr:MAG: proline dehydrogenase [Candidatus Nitrosocaldaceae archaeon]
MHAIYERLLTKIAKHWIAGNSLEDAIESVKSANKLGIHAIINYLGEHIIDKSIIDHTVEEYIEILDKIDEEKLDCSISLKPTQLGLDITYDEYYKNINKILEYANKKFVWIDMESYSYLDSSIESYLQLLKSYDNIGIAVQAYLRDITVYVAELLDANASIRLVKGAYREDANIVFKSKGMVDRNYIKIMQLLFKYGNYFAIATHDQKIIDEALKLSKIYKTRFEFQMLKGIRDDLKKILVSKGYSVGEYIPYGSKILEYSLRRIKEHPTNILLLVRSLI